MKKWCKEMLDFDMQTAKEKNDAENDFYIYL